MQEIKIGMVGYGGIAKTHAIALYAMKILYPELPFTPNLVKAYRRDPAADRGPFDSIVSSLDELLQDSDLDLIDICTPNNLHYEQVKQVLTYQKAVYCEKPLALNYQAALELAELAEKQQIIQQVALVYRFVPAVVAAREYIRQGGLGDILHFKCALYHKGYLNDRPLSWRQQKTSAGAGALMDLGIHMVDLVRYLLGEVDEVQAQLSTYHKERELTVGSIEKGQVDVDDLAQVSLKLRNGAMGSVECSRISSELYENTGIEIYGSKGSIKISSRDPYYPVIHQHQANRSIQGEWAGGSDFEGYIRQIYPAAKISQGFSTDMHLASLYNLLLNITHNRIVYDATPTFREAALAQKIIDLALLSAQEQRPVKWHETTS